jgi:hypothetical protein
MRRIQIEIPALHLAPHANLDEAACPAWILPFPSIPQAALIQVHDRYSAHSIT